jgi:hypothetical protein
MTKNVTLNEVFSPKAIPTCQYKEVGVALQPDEVLVATNINAEVIMPGVFQLRDGQIAYGNQVELKSA